MVSTELKVVGGKHAGQIIPLNRRKFLIGREQDCQLRPNSEMVSRHHCVFSVDDYSVRLRDLGSTNGTLVNGERIRKDVVLAAGDKIVIGNLEFELVIRPGVTAIESDSAVTPGNAVAGSAPAKDDTQFTDKTIHEIPAVQPNAAEAANPKTSPQKELPTALTAPAASSGDTTVMNLPQMMPSQQYPYPQMMPQMGYPGGMYGGFPYQQMMPGYGQMYPQMMPQMPYPQPAPEQPAPAASTGPSVILPNPEDTGAKETEAAKGSTGASKSDTEKPTGAADAIIKQYMGRRPGG